jgi:Family of unknown function (DUF6220)
VRDAFKYLTSIIFAAVVVQVALAGYGAFYAVDKADDNDSVSKHTIEHGFNAHAILGTLMVVVMLLLLIVALAGRLGSRWVKWSAALLLLGILQIVFAAIGAAVPVLGFLHAVNALAIYATVGLMAHRAWTQRPATEAAA